MDESLEPVLARHLAKAREGLDAAEALIERGRARIAEGEGLVREGEADADIARTRLAALEDLFSELRSDVEARAAREAAAARPPLAIVVEPEAAVVQTNVGRPMAPVLDEIMGDGVERTIDVIHETMEARGYTWSRASVMNRCAALAKKGVYERRVQDGRSLYKLAATSGVQLPSGLADREGGQEGQPEESSQQGAG